MRAARLQDALERLTAAIRDVDSEIAAMKAEHDPLASHIFVSRRNYRNVSDMKSGKRREMNSPAEFQSPDDPNTNADGDTKCYAQSDTAASPDSASSPDPVKIIAASI
jgi:hypothetical protein